MHNFHTTLLFLFVCFYKSTLLRRNLQMIKCTHFKCTFQWVLTNLYTHITITMSKKMNIFIILKSSLVCLPSLSVVFNIKIMSSTAPWQQILASNKYYGKVCGAYTVTACPCPAQHSHADCHVDPRTYVLLVRKPSTTSCEPVSLKLTATLNH